MTTAARMLTGKELADGWKVVQLAPRSSSSTGGTFSTGYIVESRDGRRAFLKAMDFAGAISARDPASALLLLTKAFIFERDLMKICGENNLDRIVQVLADGRFDVAEAPEPKVVQYLIFELADGDIRSQAAISKRYDIAWTLRALHNISIGVFQLHGHQIAHQDIKPSNVLVFDDDTSKLADLGRAAMVGRDSPHESLSVVGDPTYAPPEQLYGYLHPDWVVRRFGCDAYLMGSMVFFFFTGVMFTPHLIGNLQEVHRPKKWNGTFHGALPYLRDAFGYSVDHFNIEIDESLKDDLTPVICQLCEPDPGLRGHPRTRAQVGNPYSLERYIALFDRLAKRAEFGLFSN